MINISISIMMLKELMGSKKINLIDIRNSNKYLNGTIGDAINISDDKLLYNFNKYLNKNEIYYIFCDNGFSSLKLSKLLNNLGFHTYSLDGGYNKYVLEK